jgi:hypothetical protein
MSWPTLLICPPPIWGQRPERADCSQFAWHLLGRRWSSSDTCPLHGATTILPFVPTILHPPFIQRHFIHPSTLDSSHQFPARSGASMTQRCCDLSATLELIQSETAALAEGFKRAYATGRTQLVGISQIKQVQLFEQVFFAVW